MKVILNADSFFFLIYFIEMLILNVVLISAVQQNASAIYICVCVYMYIYIYIHMCTIYLFSYSFALWLITEY